MLDQIPTKESSLIPNEGAHFGLLLDCLFNVLAFKSCREWLNHTCKKFMRYPSHFAATSDKSIYQNFLMFSLRTVSHRYRKGVNWLLSCFQSWFFRYHFSREDHFDHFSFISTTNFPTSHRLLLIRGLGFTKMGCSRHFNSYSHSCRTPNSSNPFNSLSRNSRLGETRLITSNHNSDRQCRMSSWTNPWWSLWDADISRYWWLGNEMR